MLSTDELAALVAEIDADEQIYSQKLRPSGIPVWLLIREAYLGAIVARALVQQPTPARAFVTDGEPPAKHTLRQQARALCMPLLEGFRTSNQLPIHVIGKSSIAKAGSPVRDLVVALNGSAYAWDYLTAANTLRHLSRTGDSTRNRPRLTTSRVPSIAKRIARDTLESLMTTDCIRSAPRGLVPDPKYVSELLATQITGFEYELQRWDKIFKRTRPVAVLADNGVYGPQRAIMVAASYQGIRTADIQHGAIFRNHIAYNSAITAECHFSPAWPDVLLSFGPWWGSQSNLPWLDTVVLGRINRHGAQPPSTIAREDRILVIADRHLDPYADFAIKASAWAQALGIKVALRPHPQQRIHALRKFGDKVHISSDELHLELRRTSILVGTHSTVLLEAIGIVPSIFTWDTPTTRFYMPANVFMSISDDKDLQSKIVEGSLGSSTLKREELWSKFNPKDLQSRLLRS